MYGQLKLLIYYDITVSDMNSSNHSLNDLFLPMRKMWFNGW